MFNLFFTLFANTSYHHSPIKLDGPFDGLSDRLHSNIYGKYRNACSPLILLFFKVKLCEKID